MTALQQCTKCGHIKGRPHLTSQPNCPVGQHQYEATNTVASRGQRSGGLMFDPHVRQDSATLQTLKAENERLRRELRQVQTFLENRSVVLGPMVRIVLKNIAGALGEKESI